MRLQSWLAASWFLFLASVAQAQDAKISWKKIILDPKFRSEGVAVADVNKDGKMDILVGDYWYEAPDWKPHEIRKPGNFGDGAGGYSQAFLCWAEDLNGDGWPDLIVVGFPSEPCRWYENPQGKEGHWKAHEICKSACNETPQYVDLFGKGKRVLVMGFEDKRMIWLDPQADPTQPWNIHSISDPNQKAPGTHRYAHGLGIGDLNGDGRADVLCNEGWWEQPAQLSDEPWKFHKANLGPPCADMHVVDVNGDGKVDVISSSAHGYGFWAHLQRSEGDASSFSTEPFFPTPEEQAKQAAKVTESPQARDLYQAINKARRDNRHSDFVMNSTLCNIAKLRSMGASVKVDYQGRILLSIETSPESKGKDSATLAKEILATLSKEHEKVPPGCEIGISYDPSKESYFVVLADAGKFSLPSQTHALHYVDIDGDGVKDLVTGRRWWAHGPKGDPGSGDPAQLFWFKGKRDSKGVLSFTPHQVDDHSGVGTQFTIIDVNGDGLLDIVVSNKRGVYLFLQERNISNSEPPIRKE